MRHGHKLEGWALLGWLSLALVLTTALVLGIVGVGEPGVRAGIRVTARTSYALFLLSFVASSCASIFSSGPPWAARAGKWLLRNRRALGVSFAVSMGLHLALILTLAAAHPRSFFATVQPLSMIGGGIGYAFIALMALTSFDRSARWMGRRAWKALHKTGMYYLWIVFAFSYLGRARVPVYAVLVALLGGGLALRAVAALRQRRRRAERLAVGS